MQATSGPSSLKAVRFGEEKATAEDAAGHLESLDGYETPDESIGDELPGYLPSTSQDGTEDDAAGPRPPGETFESDDEEEDDNVDDGRDDEYDPRYDRWAAEDNMGFTFG